MKKLLMGAAALLLMGTAVHASVIPTLDSATPGTGTYMGDFNFAYTGVLSADQGVQSGDYLVIVDFNGYVPGSVYSTLTDVTASTDGNAVSDLGLTQTPGTTDNPNIPDLVFEYTGSPYQTSGAGAATDFSGIGAYSTYGQTTVGAYSAVAVNNSGAGVVGKPDYNQGFVSIPAVPEPATWALMILGFLGIGAAARSKRLRTA
ncbi:MAG: PEPxxWA-CTERM sorting domain-containing protein [Caulobacteraceae bacterium]